MLQARVLTVHEACQAQSARGSCRGAQDNTTLQSFNLNYAPKMHLDHATVTRCMV